jgi:transposase InsO family protein
VGDGDAHARERGRRRAQHGALPPAATAGTDPPLRSRQQYVSLAFGRAARDAGIAVSMGSRGDAYDNAVAETFFATLNNELVNRRTWPSRLELQSAVFEYVEAFYNRQRRHSTLGMLSPVAYEQLRLSPLGR